MCAINQELGIVKYTLCILFSKSLCMICFHHIVCLSPQTKSADGPAVLLAGNQSVQFHLILTSSTITSSGLNRCLACSQCPNKIHFICNHLEPLAMMEQIKAPIKEL